jgi:pilus assembly protein CpaB
MKGLKMDRRRILLIAAVLVAALGATLVLLYVRGAEGRAEDRFEAVEVLKATATINPGESIEDAQAAGKLALLPVAQGELLPNVQSDTSQLAGLKAQVAIYPGEQIVTDKFAANAAAAGNSLQIDDKRIAMALNLTDPGRVAGFVNPGSEVAIFVTGASAEDGTAYSRVLLTRITVLAVGSTTPISTTVTDETGVSTTEQLPRTILTISVDQSEMEKVLLAQTVGELTFGLLNEDSTVVANEGTTTDDLFKN